MVQVIDVADGIPFAKLRLGVHVTEVLNPVGHEIVPSCPVDVLYTIQCLLLSLPSVAAGKEIVSDDPSASEEAEMLHPVVFVCGV